MTFEQFEKADKRKLRENAKACFERAQVPGLLGEEKTGCLQEAQFYMSELERRASSWVSIRDLVLEVVVIGLIGGEIWLGIKAGSDEDKLMAKQNAILDKQSGILNNLKDSTSDTATGMKIVASALVNLAPLTKVMSENTSESASRLSDMLGTLQAQYEEASRVSADITYSEDAFVVINTGRRTIAIYSIQVEKHPDSIQSSPISIIPGGREKIPANFFAAEKLDYDRSHQATFIPMTMHFVDSSDTAYEMSGIFRIRGNSIGIVVPKYVKKEWRSK